MRTDTKTSKQRFNWKNILPATILILFLSTTLVLLLQIRFLNKKLQLNQSANITISELNTQLQKKESEIVLCLSDQPMISEAINRPYSFQDFGVYSPDFEGKVVDHTNYQYKRNQITRNSISPDVNED